LAGVIQSPDPNEKSGFGLRFDDNQSTSSAIANTDE